MSDCHSVEEWEALRRRDLASDRMTQLEAHLKSCQECAALVQKLAAHELLGAHIREAMPGMQASSGETRSAAQVQDAAATTAPKRAAGPISIEGYEILRELHRGGQGVVYQAVQKATKRKVAIKVLREGPYASKSARSRFEREIELVAQLKHSNIVAIFDSGTTSDGWRYCAMDYIRGLPLHVHVRENHLTLEQALKIFCSVCDAVQYAHHKGVIHRDLKPSNIMVNSEGDPKILDFGLAKQLIGPVETVVSMTQDVVGTLPYMSPEQAKGNPDHIDTRTDIYALGVVLYEILTGHYPYPVVGHMADVLRNIAETPPTPPTRQWTPDSGVTQRTGKHIRAGHCPIDSELQTVILKTLAKERERRYQSAGDLARDIGHYLAGEPIEARRDSGWYVLRKALVRHKAKMAVAAGFVVLVLGFWAYTSSTARAGQIDQLIAQGMEAWRCERHEDAGDYFKKALELDPDNVEALKKIGWWNKEIYGNKPFAYQERTLLQQAQKYCQKALSTEAGNARLWNLKATVDMALGDLGEAEAGFRRALDRDPVFYDAKRNLAMVLALRDKFEEATRVAREGADAVSAESKDDQEQTDIYADGVWRVLGTLQLYRSDPQAFKSLMTARDIDRRDARNTLLLARLHLTLPEQIDLERALDEAKLADAFTSLRDPRFKRTLALAYLRNGRFKDAAVNAEAALDGGDEPAYCHLIWAIAEAKLNNSAGADEHRKKAAETWPKEFDTRDVVMTAEKDFLWFDTRAELQDLRAEAEQLLASANATAPSN